MAERYMHRGKNEDGTPRLLSAVKLVPVETVLQEDYTLDHLSYGSSTRGIAVSQPTGYPAVEISKYTLPKELAKRLPAHRKTFVITGAAADTWVEHTMPNTAVVVDAPLVGGAKVNALGAELFVTGSVTVAENTEGQLVINRNVKDFANWGGDTTIGGDADEVIMLGTKGGTVFVRGVTSGVNDKQPGAPLHKAQTKYSSENSNAGLVVGRSQRPVTDTRNAIDLLGK